MALQFVGRIAFPPTDTQFNTVFKTVYFDDVANTFVVEDTTTGISVTIGQAKVAASLAAANQALFATAPYIAYPIGTILAVINYNATTDGVTVQKTSLSGSNYTDWVVIATEDFASTGHIGQNPA